MLLYLAKSAVEREVADAGEAGIKALPPENKARRARQVDAIFMLLTE